MRLPVGGSHKLPPATAFRTAWVVWSAWVVLWIPPALLRQADAFLGFLRPTELLSDFGLAALLLALPSLAVGVGLVWPARMLLSRTRIRAERINTGLWGLTLAPCLLICAWQWGGFLTIWLRQVGMDMAITPAMRLAAALLLLSTLALAVWRLGHGGLLKPCAQACLSLRMPAALLVAASALAWVTQAHTGPAAVPASGPPAGASAPSVLLITIDTLAEVDANVCSDGHTLMPHLRAFAQEAACFSRAYSTSNFTTPATSSLETGLLPWAHGASQIVAPIHPSVQALAFSHSLRKKGYHTTSISANLMASPRHHGTQGFWSETVISPSLSWGQGPRSWLTVFGATTLPFWLSSFVPFLDTLDVYRLGEQHPHPPPARSTSSSAESTE